MQLTKTDLKRLAQTAREGQLLLFKPSPALADFMKSKERRIFLRAANRTGKTRHAAAKLAQAMLDTPNGRFRAVGVNHRQTVRVIGRYLRDFLPPSALVKDCVYSEQNGWSHQLIRLRNGAICQLLSSEQKVVAHAGDDMDGLWIDEPPPQEILSESAARVMARNGWLWVTATPVGRPVEYLREMVEAKESAWKTWVVPLTPENCPWYTPVQVRNWIEEAALMPGTYRQRIYGDWDGDTVDRIFTGWSPENFFMGDPPLVGTPFKVGIGIDHGEGIGKQVFVIAIWTSQAIWVVDEIVNTEPTTTEQDARALARRLREFGWQLTDVDLMVGDVNSGGKEAGGSRINELLCAALHREFGFRRQIIEIQTPAKGRGSVEYGERLLNLALLRNVLRVNSRCENLHYSFRHYSKGNEDLKHPIDALRYLLAEVLDEQSAVNPKASRLRLT